MAGTILAGDVGGTKTHLGSLPRGWTRVMLLRERIYANRDFAARGLRCRFSRRRRLGWAACFGVPGGCRGSASDHVPWKHGGAEARRH